MRAGAVRPLPLPKDSDMELTRVIRAGHNAAEAEHALLPSELPHHRARGDGGVHGALLSLSSVTLHIRSL